MSEPLSDILPAFFVKLKSLSQGWERAIRPRPLPPLFPVSSRRIGDQSHGGPPFLPPPCSALWEIGLTTSRNRQFEGEFPPKPEIGRSSVIFFFFFGKYRARIDEFRKVTREWRFFRDANAKWHVSHSVEKWDFRGRGWRGSTSVFDERRVVTRRSALERVFFFFFFEERLYFSRPRF